MTRALPGSLSELTGFGGTVRVKCKRCGREGQFHAGSLADWFKACGIRDDWKTIRRKFVCDGFGDEGCGGRDVEVTYELEAPDPPRRPPAPVTEAPPGIDPKEWARADSIERKRMIRRARN